MVDQSDKTPTDQTAPSTEPAAAFGAAAIIFQGNTIRYANPAAEAVTGYSAAELVGMDFWMVIHPDDREWVRDRGLARQRGEAVPGEYEVKLLCKNGASRWVAFCAGMIEFEGGPAVLGTVVDITERRAAAEQSRTAERRWEALMAHSSDVVLLADAEYNLRYIGPSMERILGIPVEEMLGYDNLDRIHPDDRANVQEAYGRLAEAPGARASATYRIHHRDGSWRWFESIGTNMLADPAVAGIVVNTRDITDRVEAETAYQTLVEHSLQGLVIIQDGRIVFANRTVVEMLGYSAAELMDFGMDEARGIIHPDDAATVWQKWQRRSRGQSQSPRTEFRLVRKDGRVRWLETYAAEIEYRGHPAWQVAYLDATDRHRAEEAARRHQQELAHVLRRRTMGEMAAVFAHEVNQPLASIMNYAKGCALRLRSGTAAPEPLIAALDQIAAQAERAAEVIRRLRGFVRKGDLQRQSQQLNDLVGEVIQFVAAEAKEHGVRLEVELEPDLPPVEVDAVQIEQVILNLLRNALEAIYEEPGERPSLRVATRRAGSEIEVTVRDSGAGLHAGVAASLFEPFVTSKSEGLGMGLSICRTIVDAHGGRVWSDANPDRGMTFHVALPLPSASARQASG
jgi:two-component system, LuxR family, sensor kinase FixL